MIIACYLPLGKCLWTEISLVDLCATGLFSHCLAVTKVSGPFESPLLMVFNVCVCVCARVCVRACVCVWLYAHKCFLAQGIEYTVLAASMYANFQVPIFHAFTGTWSFTGQCCAPYSHCHRTGLIFTVLECVNFFVIKYFCACWKCCFSNKRFAIRAVPWSWVFSLFSLW